MALILASQSPRRQELLQLFHIPFTVRVADIDEAMDPQKAPFDEVARVSRLKALAVERENDDIIIAADTIVVVNGTVLGKPRDEAEAFRMLRKLSGRTHTVYTAVSVAYRGRLLTRVEATGVRFRAFDRREAEEYVKTGEPMDKAGSYAIQGIGGALVSKFEGEFEVIVGLGLNLTKRLVESALSGEDDGVTPDE